MFSVFFDDWYYCWSLYMGFHLKVCIIEKVLNFCDEWLVLWFSSLASLFTVSWSAILGLAFNGFLSSIQVIIEFNSPEMWIELGPPLILSGDLCTTLCTVLKFYHEWLVLCFSSLASLFTVFWYAIFGTGFQFFFSSIQVIMQFNNLDLWIGDPFDFKWGPVYKFMHCIKLFYEWLVLWFSSLASLFTVFRSAILGLTFNFFWVQSRLLCNSTFQTCELGTPLILSGDLCITLSLY